MIADVSTIDIPRIYPCSEYNLGYNLG